MRWRSLNAVGVVVAVVLGAGLVPPDIAAGEEEERPKVVSFQVKASNGYTFFALAEEPRKGDEEEEGGIGIFVQRRDGGVSYGAPATVTNRTIEADLGELGRISVTRVPTDRMKTVPRGCRRGRTKRVRAQRYEGTIEFHGEEGFTEVSATRAPIRYLPIECFREVGGRTPGKALPGARLDVERYRRYTHRIEFDAVQRRPGARTGVSVEIEEHRGAMEIHRATWTWAPSTALRYDRRLRTATVRPPAPFSGHGTYRRNARPANRWTGNLTVDFPGRSGVRLTGRGFDASLEHPYR